MGLLASQPRALTAVCPYPRDRRPRNVPSASLDAQGVASSNAPEERCWRSAGRQASQGIASSGLVEQSSYPLSRFRSHRGDRRGVAPNARTVPVSRCQRIQRRAHSTSLRACDRCRCTRVASRCVSPALRRRVRVGLGRDARAHDHGRDSPLRCPCRNGWSCCTARPRVAHLGNPPDGRCPPDASCAAGREADDSSGARRRLRDHQPQRPPREGFASLAGAHEAGGHEFAFPVAIPARLARPT